MEKSDQEQLDGAVDLIRSVGERLQGCYFYGSGVAGALRPNSDIDLFVLVSDHLSHPEATELVSGFAAISGLRPPRRPLEVTFALVSELKPWPTLPRREFQFGEWIRDDLLAGRFELGVVDHDLAPLVATVLQRSVALIGPPVETVVDGPSRDQLRKAMRNSIPDLLEDLAADTANVLLTLARIAYTMDVGRVVSKDVAAGWAVALLQPGLARPLEAARVAYLDGSVFEESMADCEATADYIVQRMIE